jgi:hypothetical protein
MFFPCGEKEKKKTGPVFRAFSFFFNPASEQEAVSG